MSGSSARLRVEAWLPHAAHFLAVLWLFSGVLFGGRVFFFRDVSVHYYPNFVFASRWLREGIWPLWNPTSDAGAPFLLAYPVEMLLLAVAGPRATLALDLPLHVLLAACGASFLARVRGMGPWGSWLAGAAFGFSGFLLSQPAFSVFQAATWAPWVLAALLRLLEHPNGRRLAAFSILLALQVSTLGIEIVLQTALIAPVLLAARPRWNAMGRALAGVALAALLTAPVLLGTLTLLEGTQRGTGFPAAQALSYSAKPVVLLEAIVPRLLGNVHSFSEAGYWGQPFFPGGFPYVLSLYLGPTILLLALFGRSDAVRLWFLVGLGVLLSLGSNGPLEPVLLVVLRFFRVPVKFFFLAALGLALLAGRGLDHVLAAPEKTRRWWALLPGAVLVAVGIAQWRRPSLMAEAFGWLVPELTHDAARLVAREAWPLAFASSGLLCLAAGLCFSLPRRLRPLAGLLATLDLLAVNGSLNPSTDASFYTLRPEVQALVDEAKGEGLYRWFSYGVANSPGLRFHPEMATRASDVWLYYLDRQALLPRTQLLDGLEGAFDMDRVGWAPEGSALALEEADPRRYREIEARLRLANVRWVVGFDDLPPDRVELRGQAALPGALKTLKLFELRDPLPRAFWAPSHKEGTTPASGGGPASVRYETPDPHTVVLHASGGPGWLVVLDGYSRHWRAEGPQGRVSMARAYGRYRALPTPGGEQTYTLRYAPSWLAPACAATLAGALALLVLATRAGDASGAPRPGRARG